MFVALQLQPNEQWDINFDMQISERVQAEQRYDLNFANQKRATVDGGEHGPGLVVGSQGAILEWVGDTGIGSNSTIYSREEDYLGYGLSAKFDVNDRLRLSGDYSFSETTREEFEIIAQTLSDNETIQPNDSGGYERSSGGSQPRVSWKRNSDEVPQYTVEDFDVNDHDSFSDDFRVRIDQNVDRENTVEAFRGDFEYDLLDMDLGFISDMGIASVQGGFRHSELEYLNLPDNRLEMEIERDGDVIVREFHGGVRVLNADEKDRGAISNMNKAAIKEMNEKCRNSSFPENNFLSAVSSGPLVTQVDSTDSNGKPSGSVVSGGTGSTWATFDTQCLADAIIAHRNVLQSGGHLEEDISANYQFGYLPVRKEDPGVTDVTETTLAAYVMANFNTEVGGYPVRGNFGFRVLETDVESVGYRATYTITETDDTNDQGEPITTYSMQQARDSDNNTILEKVVAEDSYTEWFAEPQCHCGLA